VIRILVW